MNDANPDQIALQRFARDRAAPTTFDANPLAMALGTRILSVDEKAGAVRLEFAPDGIFLQGAGVLQGGAIGAMLDFAMAFAVLAALPAGQSCTTANVNVAFLRAAPRGRYVAVGTIARRGSRLAFTQASVFAADAPERVVATATSTLAILGRAQPA
jgi:uncharacterized protein (TIGR00369 family)